MKKIWIVTLAALGMLLLGSHSAKAQDTGILKGTDVVGTAPNTATVELFSKCVETAPGSGVFEVELVGEIVNSATSSGNISATFEPVSSTPTFPTTGGRPTANNIAPGALGITARFGADDVDYTNVTATFTITGAVTGTAVIGPFDSGCSPTAVSLNTVSANHTSSLWAIVAPLLLFGLTGAVLIRRRQNLA